MIAAAANVVDIPPRMMIKTAESCITDVSGGTSLAIGGSGVKDVKAPGAGCSVRAFRS